MFIFNVSKRVLNGSYKSASLYADLVVEGI